MTNGGAREVENDAVSLDDAGVSAAEMRLRADA